MAGVISFKAYLYEDGEVSKQEIRRFGIDSDVVTNFEYFRGKLQSIFADLKGKQFSIYWKDSDGDAITISSDEELVLALNETALEPIRKVYVEVRPNKQSGPEVSFCSSPSPRTLHAGVVCDGCNGFIRGFRFKCVQCPDYDLCSSCQSQELHPEHCMLRLVNPLDAKTHFGRRIVRHMNKFAKKYTHPCYDDDEDKQKESEAKENAKDKSCGCKSGHKKCKKDQERTGCPMTSDDGSWVNTLVEYLNELSGIPNKCPVQINQTDNQTKNQSENQSKDSQIPDTNNSQTNHTSSNAHKNCDIPKLIQQSNFLKVLSPTLSHFLDPLGIDVNLLVKAQDNQTSSSTNKETNNSNNNVDKKNENPTPSTSKSSSGTTTPKNSEEKNDVSKENNTNPHAVNDNNNEINANKKNVVYVIEKEGQGDAEWTMVKEVTPEVKETSTSPSAPLYPPLPKEKKIYHPDPKIQKAVEAMIQMGFSNDDGQLTNLLVAKNGDIVSVLDILQNF